MRGRRTKSESFELCRKQLSLYVALDFSLEIMTRAD